MSQTPGVERLRRLVADRSKLAPIARLLGARVLSIKGRSTVFLQAAVRDGRGHDYAHATSVGSIRRPK